MPRPYSIELGNGILHGKRTLQMFKIKVMNLKIESILDYLARPPSSLI